MQSVGKYDSYVCDPRGYESSGRTFSDSLLGSSQFNHKYETVSMTGILEQLKMEDKV